MKKIKMLGAILLSFVLVTTGVVIIPKQEAEVKAAGSTISNSDFIKASGKVLKNNSGSGGVVYLRGINAGGYSVQEFWMCPTSYTANCTDQDDILRLLTERFGAEKAKTLIDTYEDNYWTEADFDRIAGLGMNCIRLPLWYRNFVDENNNWYSDAFDRIDWFVREAGERGIYVIIDMHGAYGSQNGSDHSGIDGGDFKEAASEFFFGSNAASNQEKYYQMWEKLAEHFKGNPTVAGYDLLNEPYCTYRYNSSYSEDYLHSLLWGIYDKAYDKIRAIDPDHLIIMEATWDGWDLPNPYDYGWSNVMYEYHNYLYDDYDNAGGQQIANMQTKLNNIFCMNYDVPSYMGEFNYFNSLSAWDEGLKLLNNNGLNWTIWSYKCTSENGNWGIVNQNIGRVNIETDSYETILSVWSNAGNCYENIGLMNVVKNYTPGTVRPTQYVTVPNGTYYLSCNDKIVCADNYGNNPLIANRDSFGGSWETLHIINNADGTISFKSDINGKYVCAVIDDRGQLIARSDVIDAWEKFRLVNIYANQYAIKSVANGKYVTADYNDTENNGQLKAMSDSIAGAWEAFYFYGLEVEETQAPTEAPTTEKPTQAPTEPPTQAPTEPPTQTGGPIEVIGVVGSCKSDNTINIVWGQNNSHISSGQKYNVYVDGELKLSNMVCGEYVINDIAEGIHTVKVTAVLNGKESAGSSVQVYVTGTRELPTETITEVPTTEIPTTEKPTETPTTKTYNAYDRIEAEDFSVKEGGVIDTNADASGGYNIGGIVNGVYTQYNSVVFTENAGALDIRYSSPGGAAQGNVEIYADSFDNLVGTIKLPNNGSSWQDYGDLTARLDKEVSAGNHTIYMKYVTTGTLDYVANVDYFSFIRTAEVPMINGGIEINGYQVNTNIGGMRTIYSVEKKINGLEVVASGMVYALGDYVTKDEVYVGNSNQYVADFQSTSIGLCASSFSDSFTSSSYAMTMKFATKTEKEFNAKWYIRAYAKLSDGSYVYTDVVEYAIYDIANEIYQRRGFNNKAAHDYLYTDILSTVNPNYPRVEFDMRNALVP